MPRYFIDMSLDGASVRDEDGADYAGLEAAREDMLEALAQIFNGRMGTGQPHALTGLVRDRDGNLVFKAHLSLTVEDG